MPILTELKLHPSHGLIHVQNPGIMTFFEDWMQQEIDQGFAWAPDGVSFQLLTDHSNVNIGIAIEDNFVPLEDAVRVICVPFDVSASGSIVVSELFQDGVAAVPQGKYALYFETGYTSLFDPARPPLIIDTWCRLTFVQSVDVEASVVRAEAPLAMPLILRTAH